MYWGIRHSELATGHVWGWNQDDYYVPNVRELHLPGCAHVADVRRRCWDGKNIDSPNHKDHVAYPTSGSFESGGPCPSTHPVKMPQLMYEVMWDTTPFNDAALWPEDGSQPFVYSMGDA